MGAGSPAPASSAVGPAPAAPATPPVRPAPADVRLRSFPRSALGPGRAWPRRERRLASGGGCCSAAASSPEPKFWECSVGDTRARRVGREAGADLRRSVQSGPRFRGEDDSDDSAGRKVNKTNKRKIPSRFSYFTKGLMLFSLNFMETYT
ncbi:Transport And Golgi Organization Protein 1 [Manis pentadactyla]|nr:Transport And Golgi Organization Protein 1 [Manis pentadactyla]